MQGLLLACSLLIALCAAVPTQLNYTLGATYVYNVTGIVQNNGYDSNAQEFVPGYYSTMQAIMAMQPIQEDETAYLFVMNLFGTVVSVSNTSGSSGGAGDPSDALGDDVYFTQLKTGEIVEIQYYSDDPIYYVNVKVSAINAFQTSIVPVGNTQVILESDPVGNHSAQVSGAAGADGSLFLTKVFSQVDFTAFPDPTVTPQNMFINAKAVTGVHAEGYIMSSNLDQVAIFTDASPSQSKRAMTNSTGFDMDLSAIGSLSVQFAPNLGISKTFAAQADGYVTANMFDFAAKATLFAKTNAATIDLKETIKSVLNKDLVKFSTLTKIGNHLRYNPQDTDILVPLFETGLLEDATIRDRIFFILTVAQNQPFLEKYGLQNKNCAIVMRAVLAAPHIKTPSQGLIASLRRIVDLDECPFAQAAARSIVNPLPAVSASNFPFNKSISVAVSLGGKVASVNFTADLIAGTNLNCKNSQFNYEASAGATATATLFGYSQQAFDAQVIYGQANGAPLADAITLSVWGNVVYNHPIPSVSCEAGEYPLAHSAPGFNVQHTLWVSIIPIVFSASASLDLTASWGWNVCPTQLSASIDVSGDGAIELSGSSYTDLLLLRAGFDLAGSFNTAVIPQAFVQGTACQIGFEVDSTNAPMDATFTSYYQWQKCKFLFFDCTWGDYNQQNWWTWNEPAKDSVLFKQTYQIE